MNISVIQNRYMCLMLIDEQLRDAGWEADTENLRYSSYNGKTYRPSVNALIRALIEEEMGVSLDGLKASE